MENGFSTFTCCRGRTGKKGSRYIRERCYIKRFNPFCHWPLSITPKTSDFQGIQKEINVMKYNDWNVEEPLELTFNYNHLFENSHIGVPKTCQKSFPSF